MAKVSAAEVEELLRKTRRPMKASEIARELGVPRSKVNGVLHDELDGRFSKRVEDFSWTVRTATAPPPQAPPASLVTVESYFAPEGKPIAKLCHLLGAAKSEVLVQAFYLKSQPITDALIDAHKRKVKVKVLLGCTTASRKTTRDPANRHGGRKNPVVTRLHESGVEVFEDHGEGRHATRNTNNHNKCAVIDKLITVTGGLNFCDVAEENADNMIVIHSAVVAKQFADDWFANFRRAARFQEDE